MGGWAYEKVNPRTGGPYRQYISSEMIGQNYFSYDVVMVTWRQRKYPKPGSAGINDSRATKMTSEIKVSVVTLMAEGPKTIPDITTYSCTDTATYVNW